MKKRALALLLALVMLLGLVACGSKTDTNTTDTGSSDNAANGEEKEAVTLSAWYYSDPGVAEGYQAWADAVHEAYPWITIELEELPYDSGPEKFTVACATGTTPDIYFDGYSRISAAVHGGICMDLTNIVSDHQDLFIGDITDGVVDGKNYYIPMWDGGGYCLAVNLTLAERLGVADMLPEDWTQWSYDDFLEICRAAKAADPSIYPTALWAGSQSSDAAYYNLLVGAGVELTNEDLTATAFNTPEALEVLEFLHTIIDEELCPAGYATAVDTDLYAPWNAGTLLFRNFTAFTNAGLFESDLAAGNRVDFDWTFVLAPTPTGDYTPNGVSWGSYGACAFPIEGHEEAVELALNMFLEEPEYQNTILNAWGKFSRMNNTTIEYSSEELAELMQRCGEYSAEYTVSDFGILEGWWTDFRMTFYPQLQDYYLNNIDAQTMLDNWQAAGDEVIAKAAAEQ